MRNSKQTTMFHGRRAKILITSLGVLVVAALAVAGTGLNWNSAEQTSYVFTPCPGLIVTSTATTAVWNCPNESATIGASTQFTTGEFVTITGTWATGYGTLGCVPQTGETSCVVPMIASIDDYLYTDINGGMWFVIQPKQGLTVQLKVGEIATVSGILQPITYPTSPGSTYPIYHLNNQTGESGLIHPQPMYEVTNATATQ